MSVCELKNCMEWRWKEQNVLGTRTENLSVRHKNQEKEKSLLNWKLPHVFEISHVQNFVDGFKLTA